MAGGFTSGSGASTDREPFSLHGRQRFVDAETERKGGAGPEHGILVGLYRVGCAALRDGRGNAFARSIIERDRAFAFDRFSEGDNDAIVGRHQFDLART